MEQGTGIEPASEAWEAPIIADILTLLVNSIIAEGGGNIKTFLSKGFWACIKSETVMAGMLSKIFCKLYDALFLWENSSRSGDNMV